MPSLNLFLLSTLWMIQWMKFGPRGGGEVAPQPQRLDVRLQQLLHRKHTWPIIYNFLVAISYVMTHSQNIIFETMKSLPWPWAKIGSRAFWVEVALSPSPASPLVQRGGRVGIAIVKLDPHELMLQKRPQIMRRNQPQQPFFHNFKIMFSLFRLWKLLTQKSLTN